MGIKGKRDYLSEYEKTSEILIQELQKELINRSVEAKQRNALISSLIGESNLLTPFTVNRKYSHIFIAYICSYYEEPLAELSIFAKQMATYFLREYFKMNYAFIGELLAYADHTTAMRNVKVVTAGVETLDNKYVSELLAHKQWLRKLISLQK